MKTDYQLIAATLLYFIPITSIITIDYIKHEVIYYEVGVSIYTKVARWLIKKIATTRTARVYLS